MQTFANVGEIEDHAFNLRCMYGRFYEDLIFSDFAYRDRGFSELQFFQSWASSCIDIDIVDVVGSLVPTCSVVVVIVVIQSILFGSKSFSSQVNISINETGF